MHLLMQAQFFVGIIGSGNVGTYVVHHLTDLIVIKEEKENIPISNNENLPLLLVPLVYDKLADAEILPMLVPTMSYATYGSKKIRIAHACHPKIPELQTRPPPQGGLFYFFKKREPKKLLHGRSF